MNLFSLLSIQNSSWKAVLIVLIIIPAKAMSQYNVIGAKSGKSQSLYCPANKFAVGLFVVHNKKVIIRVRVKCSGVDTNTGLATLPTTLTISSSTTRSSNLGLTSKNYNCPQGQFISAKMEGYAGKIAIQTVVSGLKFQCIRFSNINHIARTSLRQNGPTLHAGAKFKGSAQRSQSFGKSNVVTPEIAMIGLSVSSGYALNSVSIYGELMPWYKPLGNN